MKNILEDELVEDAVNESDVERLLGYKNVYVTTDQLLKLYNRGHKTAVMSSNKITDRFIELIDLSGAWYNYAPLCKNRTLKPRQLARLIERLEKEKNGEPETLLRVYLFSALPLDEALAKISSLTFPNDLNFWNETELFMEARLDDLKEFLIRNDSEASKKESWELYKDAQRFAHEFLISANS